MAIPKYDDLFNPILKALHELGGSASVEELQEKVSTELKLTDEEINEIHNGNRTTLGYRLAWARFYLKRIDLIENSKRGVWSLTAKGLAITNVKKEEVNKLVKQVGKKTNEFLDINQPINTETGEVVELPSWQEEMLDCIKALSPQEFERLCQRILRESGFIQVDVTGRSGDGGIDGKGIMRIAGLISFHIIFQCKRYKNSVGSQEIREFKGTMVGRGDKGLFITTGSFTSEAKKEANREGSSPIDLIDGERLVEIMKDLGLGAQVTTQEVVEIKKEWFDSF